MFGRKKKSALDKRIDSLVAEMAAVERDMKSLSREGPRAGRAAPARSPSVASPARPSAPAVSPAAPAPSEPSAPVKIVPSHVSAAPRSIVPVSVRPSPEERPSAGRPIRAEPQQEGGAGAEAETSTPVGGTAPPAGDGLRKPKTAADLRDIRFVSYLVDRGFQSPSRPVRSERRVEKDKALVMTIFVAVVLLWVLFRCFL